MTDYVARPLSEGRWRRLVPATGFAFELDGKRVAEVRLRLLAPNRYTGPGFEDGIDLTQSGALRPRFEARRADGTVVAALAYSFATGRFDLLGRSGEREPVARVGFIAPTLAIGDVLEIEPARLGGAEFTVRVTPDEAWTEPALLLLAALLLHARVSLSVLFGAAASAGALAPARVRLRSTGRKA